MGQITGVRGILPAENQGLKARLKELGRLGNNGSGGERKKPQFFGKIQAESLYVTLVWPTSLAKMTLNKTKNNYTFNGYTLTLKTGRAGAERAMPCV